MKTNKKIVSTETKAVSQFAKNSHNIYIYIYILILAFISLSFLSCKTDTVKPTDTGTTTADSAGNTDDGEEIEADDGTIKDSLPSDLNFNGETLNLLIRADSNVDPGVLEFGAETENANIVNDIIYRRDKAVEDRLNMKLNVIVGSGWENYGQDITKIRASISAGDQSYDLIAGWSARIPSLSVEGLLMNLHDVDYLDFEKPWWNQIIVDEMTVNKKLNFAVGDGNLSLLANCMIIFANNKIQQDYELPNIYDAVFDGTWTIDYMNNLIKDVHSDLNGDGKMNAQDLYGAYMEEGNRFDGFLQASNIKMIKMNEDGMPYLDMEYEKLATLVDKVYNLIYKNDGSFTNQDPWNYSYDMFRNNQIYLAGGWLIIASELRDMESDYSIVPYPKFDEAQDKYYTRIQDGVSLFCIPINSDKSELAGAFMEAAAAESYKSVSPAYFDVAMKVKYARDETTSKMLDIIRDGAYLNFASIYNESIGGPWFVMRDLMSTRSNKFASWYDKKESQISTALDKLIEQMEAAD